MAVGSASDRPISPVWTRHRPRGRLMFDSMANFAFAVPSASIAAISSSR